MVDLPFILPLPFGMVPLVFTRRPDVELPDVVPGVVLMEPFVPVFIVPGVVPIVPLGVPIVPLGVPVGVVPVGVVPVGVVPMGVV